MTKHNRKAVINLEVDKDGNMVKSVLGGNVGSMFSAMAAAYSYLISEHNLNANEVMDTAKLSVITALDTNTDNEVESK